MELRAEMELMANGIAVKLDFLAEVAGDNEWWWVTHLFVKPKAELMSFNRHTVYTSLHTAKGRSATL